MQYITRMKMNEFLIAKVIDDSNNVALSIHPHILDNDETIFMNLAIEDGIFEMSNEFLALTSKGRIYLEYLIKNKVKLKIVYLRK